MARKILKLWTILLLLVAFVNSSAVVLALHEGCVNQDWCKEPNTYCSPGGFCSCVANTTEIKVGLYYHCIIVPSPISGLCSEDAHCPDPATCDLRSNKCGCPPESHTPSLNLTSCLKYADHIGAECKESEVCQQIENSECYDGYCMCRTGFLAGGEDSGHGPSSCLRIAVQLSNPCSEDGQCQVILGKNTVCTDNKCYCKHGFAFNGERNKCHPFVDGFDQSCEINEQCMFHLGHAKCNANRGVCRCDSGYISNDDGTECISEF